LTSRMRGFIYLEPRTQDIEHRTAFSSNPKQYWPAWLQYTEN
jgi:hypothetical protein